ncbi:hypothetical protein [Microcoleus sp. FACHB-672]|uniref:hypothetical protein n=1 Tax=Microcoleus sp. FACHB-672 TaxID=2692825 RepID=UPI001682C525|nr:hypothetical protein [Microcoleus sp. FACHB-672]MBD2039185.1 hypothetical protein [Microcoleus sp. FACHB-672]
MLITRQQEGQYLSGGFPSANGNGAGATNAGCDGSIPSRGAFVAGGRLTCPFGYR